MAMLMLILTLLMVAKINVPRPTKPHTNGLSLTPMKIPEKDSKKSESP